MNVYVNLDIYKHNQLYLRLGIMSLHKTSPQGFGCCFHRSAPASRCTREISNWSPQRKCPTPSSSSSTTTTIITTNTQYAATRRRQALMSLTFMGPMLLQQSAKAASVPPISAANSIQRLSQVLPFPLPVTVTPEPVKFPRKPLDQQFAVLLMRSGYDAVGLLDFIPMDKFEAKFWKLRQSELEGYNLLYAPLRMRQGDLTDPLYFDFISFSQMATITREMQHPLQEFDELVCADDDETCGRRLVVRPPQYRDDQQLPSYFFNLTGDLIYQGLCNGFRSKVFGGPLPAPPNASIQQLAGDVQQLLSIMVTNGLALKATVSEVQPGNSGSGGKFQVSLQGNCNLWGMQALAARQSAVVNAYDVMVTDAYLRASGRRGSFKLQLTDSGLEEEWTVV